MTGSMQRAIEITQKRRELQEAYNTQHNITPKTTKRALDENLKLEDHGDLYAKHKKIDKMPASEKKAIIKELSLKMKAAAKELNFEEAARLRDEITKIKKL
jgi:excinuclease ABC subunit B